MKRKILIALATAGALGFVACGLAGGVTNLSGLVKVCDVAGSCPTGGSATGDGDLLVEDALEVDGATDLDGTLAVAGALTMTGAATASSTLAVTGLLTENGGSLRPHTAITDTYTVLQADCGSTLTVSAGIDTKSITLPAAIDGCVLTFAYIGADAGALVDISPNASDGIFGTCTLAASVVQFSGTDDADIGLTKASSLQGDSITLASDGVAGWYVTACSGIWANN